MKGEIWRTLEGLLLKKGDRVQFRSDLSIEDKSLFAGSLDTSATYKVFHIERHGDGSDSVWLGPSSATRADINAFKPNKFSITELKHHFPNVLPVSIKFIEKAK